MYNFVLIDEKWFFLSREVERYYPLSGEHEPLRTCKSKRFITKVMFLAAIAQPRFDAFGNEEFSGKIGIFLKKHSRNLRKGVVKIVWPALWRLKQLHDQ